jgi:hypothetical protein
MKELAKIIKKSETYICWNDQTNEIKPMKPGISKYTFFRRTQEISNNL